MPKEITLERVLWSGLTALLALAATVAGSAYWRIQDRLLEHDEEMHRQHAQIIERGAEVTWMRRELDRLGAYHGARPRTAAPVRPEDP